VGKPLKHFEVKLVDPLTHQEVGEGQAGQLVIQGESLARSYWNDPVRTERSFINGSYLSDDLFSQKNGNYYILGRIDEMLKTGCGEWISPSEIETVICKLDEVQDAAVVGAHDDQGVIRLKALIVLAQRFQPSIAVKEKIIHAVENEFKELVYKRITQLEFVSHLPRGASGKLQRYLLKSKSLNDFSYDC
jgi:acyl-coenzyme A synthetase/AMP-(fatty) acid ligase